MKIGPVVVLVGLAFAAGWWMGHVSTPPPPLRSPVVESPRETETKALLNQALVGLTEAKTEEERSQRSDELLEKIFKLFLIEVGLRLQKPAPEAAASNVAPPPPVAEPRVDTPPAAKPAKTEDDPRRKRRVEIQVVNAPSDGSLERALKQLAKEDFESGFKSARSLNSTESAALLGTWEGRAEFDDRRHPWTVRLKITPSAKSTADHPQFKYEVRMVKARGSISNKSGDGDLQGFSRGAGDLAPIFIEAGGDVLQLYASTQFDGLVGLVFEEQGRLNLKPTGRLRLERTGR